MGDDPNKLSHGTWKCWIKADGTPFEMPERIAYKISKNGNYIGLPYKETIQQINEHTKEVGRYHVSFGWKGEKYGHIVTMERKADGTALWYDPQTGRRDFFDREYAKKIKGVRAYRVDNLLFDAKNWNVVRPIDNEAYITPSPKNKSENGVPFRGKKSDVVGSIQLTDEQKQYRKELQNKAIKDFKGVFVENKVDIQITSKSIKEFLNQPHKDYFIKNEQVKHLDKLIRNAKYLTRIVDKHGNPNIPYSHIFEVVFNGEKSWLIAREDLSGTVVFHGISDTNPIK